MPSKTERYIVADDDFDIDAAVREMEEERYAEVENDPDDRPSPRPCDDPRWCSDCPGTPCDESCAAGDVAARYHAIDTVDEEIADVVDGLVDETLDYADFVLGSATRGPRVDVPIELQRAIARWKPRTR